MKTVKMDKISYVAIREEGQNMNPEDGWKIHVVTFFNLVFRSLKSKQSKEK